MANFAIDLLVFRYKQDMREAEETFEKYYLLSVGVEDDSGYVEELDKALQKWIEADEKLTALAIVVNGRKNNGFKEKSKVAQGLDKAEVAH